MREDHRSGLGKYAYKLGQAREVLRISPKRSLVVLWAQQDPDFYMGALTFGSKLIHMRTGEVAGGRLSLCMASTANATS